MADIDLPEADFYRVVGATTGLKIKEIKEIEDVFDYFDTDHDNLLCPDQAVLGWKAFGIFVKSSEMIGSATVSRQRFVQLVGKYNKQINSDSGGLLSEYFEQMYNMIVASGKGVMTAEELLAFLRSSGMQTASLDETKKLVEAINKFGNADEFTNEDFVKHMLNADKRGYLRAEEKLNIEQSNVGMKVAREGDGNNSDSSVEANVLFSGFGF